MKLTYGDTLTIADTHYVHPGETGTVIGVHSTRHGVEYSVRLADGVDATTVHESDVEAATRS